MNVTSDELAAALERGRQKLFQTREMRVKPARDEKVLTAWNGLMLASFAEAAAALNRPDYLAVAQRNAKFVLEKLYQDGLLLRTYKDGQAKLNGYLEDYSFFIDGLLLLFETTGALRWLKEALVLADKMVEQFWDDKEGGFFFTGKHHEQLIVRTKDYFDNATPSGNSVAADVLLRLAVLTDREDLRRVATALLRLIAEVAARYPSGFGRALCALDFHLGRPKEIAVIGDAAWPTTRDLMQVVWQGFLPNKVVALATSNNAEAEKLVPLLRDRPLLNNQATAYVCEHYTCRTPVNTPAQLRESLWPQQAAAS